MIRNMIYTRETSILTENLIEKSTLSGSDQPVGGEPGEASGGAVQTALLHGLPTELGATKS